jgi:hypothetical protein
MRAHALLQLLLEAVLRLLGLVLGLLLLAEEGLELLQPQLRRRLLLGVRRQRLPTSRPHTSRTPVQQKHILE